MKMYWCVILFVCSLSSLIAQSQSGSITLNVTYQGQIISPGQNYYSEKLEDSIQFDQIRFYLSNIQYLQNGALVHTLTKKHHLIDIALPESQLILVDSIQELNFDAISFTLGIDSTTSVSGAMGGDLDPTMGMYWTWQTGYVNFKLEGITQSCPGRNNQFQFHIGGYKNPNNATRSIQLLTEGQNDNDLIIDLSIDSFLNEIDLVQNYKIMSPGPYAMKAADLVTHIFTIRK